MSNKVDTRAKHAPVEGDKATVRFNEFYRDYPANIAEDEELLKWSDIGKEIAQDKLKAIEE